jgi:hypothetical protein
MLPMSPHATAVTHIQDEDSLLAQLLQDLGGSDGHTQGWTCDLACPQDLIHKTLM